jgi:acetyl-CoA/propionyl-CoA carboxylase biotin carboxyl carrier protein
VFESVLVANRGEIAVRVIRAGRELGIRTVAVYSEGDEDALHVRMADEAHLLGPDPATNSYLRIDRIMDVARSAKVDAVHPGYGFLSENAEFARAVIEAGLSFVGPSPSAIESMGDKLSARAVADAAGVPVVPGSGLVHDAAEVVEFGAVHGYSIAIKAMFGGGGRGMKVVRSVDEVADALESARRESVAAFGRGECYLERYLERPRHIEVQIIADHYGSVVHLGDRDCSVQRRHQKLIEEAPAPRIAPGVRAAIAQAAVKIAHQIGYFNAGTCEFLLDDDGTTFYFLEMNTRLQVEHPVTELVTGIDLVRTQLRIAAGEPLGLEQSDIRVSGHAIEFRINAEDPATGFMPTPGEVTRLHAPLGPGVRFDSGIEGAGTVSPYYDSMIGKLIVTDTDRGACIARASRALNEMRIVGTETTLPFHRMAIKQEQFVSAEHSTASLEREWSLDGHEFQHDDGAESEEVVVSAPTDVPTAREVCLTIGGQPRYVRVYGVAGARRAQAGVVNRDRSAREAARRDVPELKAPMHGTIVRLLVEDGAQVAPGDLICVLEAMKMEHPVTAKRAGRVQLIESVGAVVPKDSVIARISA